eukprot:bmy_08553T0
MKYHLIHRFNHLIDGGNINHFYNLTVLYITSLMSASKLTHTSSIDARAGLNYSTSHYPNINCPTITTNSLYIRQN